MKCELILWVEELKTNVRRYNRSTNGKYGMQKALLEWYRCKKKHMNEFQIFIFDIFFAFE